MCTCVWLVDDVTVIITVQDGKTALHLASKHGHAMIVRLLIGANADLNLQDQVLYM